MNIITRKKEIMEVIEKLNEATKLANDALVGLEQLEKTKKKTKTTKATRMFNKNSVTIGGVEYVKTNEKPKNGDYVVFNKKVPKRTKKDVLYPVIGVDKFYVKGEGHLWLGHWIYMYNLECVTFTKKSLTRKEVISKAMDYIHTHTENGYYFTNDERCCKVYFTHNREKSTSTLVLKGYFSGTVRHKETIKCHPEDAYNETIGKAILIARANKDTEMKELFENAPQPTEIKEGMYIDILVDNILVFEKDFLVRHYNGKKDVVQGSDRYGQHDRKIGGIKQDGFVVKDDSNVIY